jgi:hypothetical protein
MSLRNEDPTRRRILLVGSVFLGFILGDIVPISDDKIEVLGVGLG